SAAGSGTKPRGSLRFIQDWPWTPCAARSTKPRRPCSLRAKNLRKRNCWRRGVSKKQTLKDTFLRDLWDAGTRRIERGQPAAPGKEISGDLSVVRSEERRVGNEGTARRAPKGKANAATRRSSRNA